VAIKGKGKTRSRPPARAPRRIPVEVPTPLLRRRWVHVAAAMLVGAGIVWFLVWLTNGIRRSGAEEREAAAQVERRRAVQGWKALVEGEIAKVGTLGGPGTPPTIAAELGPALEALRKGRDDVAGIEGLDERLMASADALEGYELADAIGGKGFDTGEANALTNSKDRFVSALRTYASATRLALAAAALPDGERRPILDEADALARVARETVHDAWNEFQIGLHAAGLTAGAAGAGGAVPGGAGTGLPTGG
jgi:hypothetical protein